MTIKNVSMPGLGESVTQASISQWLVKPGEKIRRYSPLAEVVSDKVTTEIPSDFSGVIKELLVPVDKEVAIGTVILTIEVDENHKATQSKEESVLTTLAQQDKEPIKSSKEELNQSPTARYSPAVLKLAQEKNVSLTAIYGSGENGRITRKDVLKYVESEKRDSPSPVNITKESIDIQHPKIKGPQELASTSINQKNDVVVPADSIRKEIAKNMVRSVTEIPHAWMMIEVDVSTIVALRREVKNRFNEREGLSLSLMPFFAKATVQALKKHPKINSSWKDGSIIYHQAINLSIAVTTPDHLYVPVIHDADNYSFVGLAKEIDRLIVSVRNEKLSIYDVRNGTFTLNNTGSLGSIQSMGIINYPQAAILQIGTITKKLTVTPNGQIKIADMISLCLSIDHRALDGQEASSFLNDIKLNLENFQNEADMY